ncbi:MAG TPA: ankyrin repeat domain-containing protein [Gemmatimonadaceae bacterium]|nr:ankyrin repeat domain-containing protein [Gemmatimonadaceae bacterium]
MSDPTSKLPARPSLEQLRKRAKDLLRAARAGDHDAASRFRAMDDRWTAGSVPQNAILADAQLVIAREHGFASWGQLVRHVAELPVRGTATVLGPMIRPVELRGSRPYTLADGSVVTTDDVFRMFVASRAGDLGEVKALIARAPGLAVVEYNYTPPIHFAVREGHLTLVELLIERGADLAYRSYPFQDSLLMMAEDREHWEVAALLRRHLSRKFALATGTKEIIDAARAGDLGRVHAELARDANLARASNETGDTALHQAAHNGHLDIVQALLAAGADPDAVRGDGYRPVHLALMPNVRASVARERSAAIADALLARGVRYTMFIAAMRGDEQFIRDALRRDRSLANEEDTCHHRPISAAARRSDLEMVRLLLEHGADPSAPEEGAPRGHALWMAVHNRQYELSRLLLEHGADPNGMVESSGTPMDQARRDPRLLSLLRAHGGIEPRHERDDLGRMIAERRFGEFERIARERPDLLNDEEWGDGILAGPANKGDHEVLELLIRLGARVPLVSKWAPYYYFKHEATAAFLLEHGMDPNHMNWHRLTLLHHMAAEGELRKTRLLVEHGAAIDAIDEEYRSTPLGLAARRGQRELISYLLERGADPNLAGAPWATPLAWAIKRGHDDIAGTLRAAGASGNSG